MKTSEMFPGRRDLPSFEDVKARTSMVVLVGRNVVLKKNGPDHFGLCPFHNEKTPSFTVNETKRFFHCFGCGAHGDAFDYLRRTQSMQLQDALEYLAIEAGLSPDHEGRRRPTHQPITPPAAHSKPAGQNNPNGTLARAIWDQSQPAADTPVEAYLRGRGINIPVPPSIRYNPGVKHTQSGLLLPAMVAAVQAPDRSTTAIHRTYLLGNGRGKAPVTKPKKLLGSINGGAVRLAYAGPKMVIAEGLETALSVLEATGLPVWAALSASYFIGLALPALPLAAEVVIAADHDEAGLKAAEKAAARWASQGRQVSITYPPTPNTDFNDMARDELSAQEGFAA